MFLILYSVLLIVIVNLTISTLSMGLFMFSLMNYIPKASYLAIHLASEIFYKLFVKLLY